MQSLMNRPTGLIRVAFLVVILVLALAAAACSGGNDTGASATTSTAGAAVTGSSTTGAAQTTTSVALDTTTAASPSSTAGATTTASSAVSTSSSVTTATSGAATTATTAKATTTTAKATTTTAAPTTTTAAKGPIVLTVSGPSGTKQLTMADLKAMPAVSGYGGWKNQLGNITAPSTYKGVSLLALVQLVGGSGGVTVVASDGYTMGLSANEVSGGVATYDPATGEAVTGIAVKTIVAYSKDGGALDSKEGPLRIAFVSSDKGQVTSGDRWARLVIELRVK
jgi:hypothetical protein